MVKSLQRISTLAVAATLALQAFGVPAKPGLMTVTNADGTQLSVRLVGDEYHHQMFTEDGYPLMEVAGNYYYCDIAPDGRQVSSGIKAVSANQRNAAARAYIANIDKAVVGQRLEKASMNSPRRDKVMSPARALKQAPAREAGVDAPPYPMGYGLFPESRFPAYGDQKAIVVLVEYTDVKFDDNYEIDAHDYFSRMLNEDGFSDLGATGCAAEYFRLNSGDAFRPEFDLFGPITLSHNMSYYGGNDWAGNDLHPEEMAIEACQQLDDTVNFADYDRDGDGYIDNIFVFYAGRGEAGGGSSSTVWPHSWNVTAGGHSESSVTFDGVVLDRYACSNEWEGSRPDGVGTFVHEFSHVMGLPDLYATSYTSSFTPGEWSALDYGPYNNGGMTPPLYGAFERYALGWMEPRVIDGAVSATLRPIGENVAGLINTPKDTEFFLLENRQKTSWDTYLPGHGMLVWHVDYNDNVWTRNQVNNTPSHQYVDIEEADGTQSEGSRAGDAFPGTGNKTSFTDDTRPSMKTWGGVRLDLPITEITETEEGLITFNVAGGAPADIPAVTLLPIEESDIDAHSIKISWNKAEGFDHLVSVYTKAEEAGEPTYVRGYKNFNAKDAASVVVTDLEPETDYYFTVCASNGWQNGAPSEEGTARTKRENISAYAVEACEAINVHDKNFEAVWNELEEATDYMITVYTKEIGDPMYEVCDFTGGVENMKEGWSSNSGSTYGMASYSGEAVPSLRLGSSGDYLLTPSYEEGVSELSFWSRGNGAGAEDEINVYANVNSNWEKVASYSVVTTAGGQTIEVEGIPEGTSQCKIEYVRSGNKGSLAIDDVKVGYGYTFTNVPLEAYVNVPTGNVLSYVVENLTPETTYYYTICATDGTYVSKPSNEIKVTTTKDTGIAGVTDGNAVISLNKNVISVAGGFGYTVMDASGRVIAKTHGKHTVSVPGIYIVNVPEAKATAKLIVR